MGKRKVETFMDVLMTDKEFKKRFERKYQNLCISEQIARARKTVAERARDVLKLILTLSIIIFFAFSGKSMGAERVAYSPTPGKYGGQITLAAISDPRSFNPILAKETSTTAITGHLFEGLVRINGITLEPEPCLAKSWEVTSGGLVWTFHLREGVEWSDGKPFTADDVVFTFNKLIYNEDIHASARDIFTIADKQLRVEKVDKLTVKFALPVKFAPFLRAMSQEILPRHRLEKAVAEGKFNWTWGLDTKPEEIIGTGAFVLDKYLPGERIILKKNPNYWRKDKKGQRLPYVDKTVFLIVQNQDVALLKFQEKELDYYGMRGSDFPLLKPREKADNFTVYDTGPAFGTNFLVFNQNRGANPNTGKPFVEQKKLGWFTDRKFRQAVAYAIDREQIINIVMNGLGYPQYAAMSPSAGFFYNGKVKTYEYNPQKAKLMLKEAGFVDSDGDGYLEDEKGNAVEFSLYTNSGNTARLEIAEIIRKDLEKLGMKVHFMQLEFNNLVAKLDATFDWDAIIIGLTGGIEPHFGNSVWQSSGHLHMWYPRQKSPATAWEAKIDTIFDLAVQELNPEKRKVLYDEWQSIVAEEVPFIYTVLPASIFAVRNKLGNLYPTPSGGAFHNIEEIYIK